MKGFSNVSRAATCASGVILESRPARSVPESVVAKRRDSVTLRAAKPYGMTSAWGGRTVNTSILSSPKVSVGDLFLSLLFLNNDRFPTTTLGNDISIKKGGHPELVSGSTAWVVSSGFTLIELLVVVLIIGILAAAALPSYRVAVASSRVATMQVLVRAVDQAQQHFYMQTGRYAANLDGLIIAMPSGFTKTDEKHISSNDMYCYIMDNQGAWSVSFKCEDKKSNVWLEKYHNTNYTLCSAREDDSFGNRVCQNLSGKDERTGAWNDTSGGRSYYYFLGN
ncbi:type IV pilin protein [Candidatus Avelusimicrobium stercoris]|uniref:type IV pilin protein n=1 Tax=Candidatus Avelusimicrobium stercoris TaxID=1947924 RepID=UPI003D10E8F0